MKIDLVSMDLELKVNWKLSRNETTVKKNFVISINETFLGEIAPNIRYGETPQLIKKNFEQLVKHEVSLNNLKMIWKNNDYCHSFKFGVESALIAYEAHKAQKNIYEFLEIDKPLSKIPTSFSVPIMDEKDLKEYLAKLEHFPFIKIKVNKDNAISFVNSIASLTDKPLRVDGNEAWTSLDEYLEFENAISNLNIQFIEQPFPASAVEDYIKLKPISKFEIMADESIESNVDFSKIAKQFHSVNIKLMKASGLYNSIKLLKEARKYNLKTMIGCMIETSVGISAAMELSSLADYFDLDGSLLLKNDPYDKILEEQGNLYFKK